jgi:DNA helicase-2/ATP-dependent DNA helicase PcrA
VVFIVGLEEGLLPHIRSMDNEGQMEEERRLCYVGITRAQQRLYLLRAFRRGMMGNSGPTYASRFLREVPSHLMVPPQLPQAVSQKPSFRADWGPSPAAQPTAPARPSLEVGDLVRHSTFGEGVVMECVDSGGDHEVTVQFSDGVGLKRLLLSFAPLEKIEG